MSNITNYPTLFERVIQKYWGIPDTTINFADFYRGNDEPESYRFKAILYTICLKQINYNQPTNEDLEVLSKYVRSFEENTVVLEDAQFILEFLYGREKFD